MKFGARSILAAGGSSIDLGGKLMRILDDKLIATHVSPGGSADLLAATIFLDAVERHLIEVHANHHDWRDECALEENYGTA